MRSVVAAVVHAPEDASPPTSGVGKIRRQKADDGARSRRALYVIDSGLCLDRALETAGVSASHVASSLAVADSTVTRWRHDPVHHAPPLAAALTHPMLRLVIGSALAAQAADALAQTERLDGDPEAILHAAALLLHAVETLHATLARRGL